MPRLPSLALLAMTALAACNNKGDEKPAASKASAAPEPIPSDIVYNSFFASPSATAALKVAFDGGLDAGGGSAPEAVDAPAGKAKLVEAGAEPRAKLSYAFAMNKTVTVTSTLKVAIEGNVPGGAGEQPPFRFSYTVTAKSRTPEGRTHFEVKLQKAEVVTQGGGPELAQQKALFEKALTGLEASFDASAIGESDNVKLASEKVPRMAQQLLPLFVQSLEFLVVPVPSAPVGVGAKWSIAAPDEGTGAAVTSTYTLVAKEGNALTVKAETLLSAPKRPVEQEGAPPGSMIEEKGSGAYTIVAHLDGIASKADGSTTNSKTITVPQRGSQTVSVKQTQALEAK